jgi:hypothetical protein
MGAHHWTEAVREEPQGPSGIDPCIETADLDAEDHAIAALIVLSIIASEVAAFSVALLDGRRSGSRR